jgi:uncharacterized protein YPO0396
MEKIKNTEPGFRLEYLELYNWGTLDGTIERVILNSKTSLLTGANGSGKTTIVDALLTLLVPNTKRFYNQSSGAEQKKERDETSYVLGYYGKSMDEEETEAKHQMLRKKSDCSVLVGCFFNADAGQYVSLVQVRWFSSTELKRAYIVAPYKLTIKEHFSNIDPRGDWRKKLRKDFSKLVISDSFTTYSDEFIHQFGMRSNKALSLFNLTVGIKVIGNLNEFIRVNMLEEGDAEQEFQQLRENLQNLIETHTNIQKAEKQIEMLEPVLVTGNQYQETVVKVNILNNLLDAVKIYFPKKEKKLREEEITTLSDELESSEGKKANLTQNVEDLRNQESSLKYSIENNDSQKAVERIDEQIDKQNGIIIKKKVQAQNYNKLAKQLGLNELKDESQFLSTREILRDQEKSNDENTEQAISERVNKEVEKKKIEESCTSLKIEIESLKGRETQIPSGNLQIREGILKAIGAEASEIPFIGELLKVKDEEKKIWEASIENLMRGFGLCLLVPEKYIKAVNQYVHKTNLKGRVIYHKVNLLTKKDPNIDQPSNSLREKLIIKENSVFEPWLENRIAQQFDYICTEEVEEFQLERKALMPSGLNKNYERHEKDDTERRFGPQNYILGWDNKEKRKVLANTLADAMSRINSLTEELEVIDKKRREIQGRLDLIKELLKYTTYLEMDWSDDVVEVENLANKKEELLEKAQDLKLLITSLETLNAEIRTKSKERDDLIELCANVKQKIKDHETRLGEIKELLEKTKDLDLSDLFKLLEEYITEINSSDKIKALNSQRNATETEIRNAHNTEKETLSKLSRELSKFMQQFITPKKEITDRFPDWNGDTINLTANPESIDDFIQLHTRVSEDDLPKHKTRFRNYMTEAILERITSFKTSLDLRYDEITQHIDNLNVSLKTIDFSKHPPTYIELLSKQAKDVTIRDFKAELQSCMPNVADMALKEQDGWLNEQFSKIKDLIFKLNNDVNLRKKVIDVRNWLDFSAVEHYREEGGRTRFYDSSGSLSGGEKAQFTYTVLGAAIAYQFGINHDGSQSKSFRFITVDEAFSKLDPEKSNYLMELCKQLHLQLLVVTPLDKIHVAEPYIHACHYVENKNRKHSKVYNLTMAEYQEKKKEFKELSSEEV